MRKWAWFCIECRDQGLVPTRNGARLIGKHHRKQRPHHETRIYRTIFIKAK